jgi:Uma2 family endonuclease
MVSTQPKTFLTPEQYLEIERKAEYKSEYFRGEMFAMAGASRAHNLLVAHLLRDLGQQLRGKPCEIYPSDMRVRVSSTGLYTYPDVVAVCGEPKLLDNQLDTLLNPHLIVEVLSPSTEAYDRGRKFEHYQSIESLGEYLMITCDRIHADLHTRRPDGR